VFGISASSRARQRRCRSPTRFDLVFSNKVTHHVPDWCRALGEMTRVLEDGGHLVYSDLVAPLGRRYPTRRALKTTLRSVEDGV
jgi:ubiquinone/menaquinone biosynthesis C-methylase UbiE